MSPSIGDPCREPPAFDELGDERGEGLFPTRPPSCELEEHLADLGEVVADRVFDLAQLGDRAGGVGLDPVPEGLESPARHW